MTESERRATAFSWDDGEVKRVRRNAAIGGIILGVPLGIVFDQVVRAIVMTIFR